MNHRQLQTILVVLAIITAPEILWADLIGDNVTSTFVENQPEDWTSDPVSAIVGMGPEFDLSFGTLPSSNLLWEVDVAGNSVNFNTVGNAGIGGPAGTFVLYTLGDLDFGNAELVGFTIIVNTSLGGFDASDISFTDDSMTFDFFGSFWLEGNQLTVEFVTQSIPEPATLGLLCLGSAVLGLTRRRKKVA